jgi:hypothetical protein
VFPVGSIGVKGVFGVAMRDVGTRAPGDLQQGWVNRLFQSWIPHTLLGGEYITRAYKESDSGQSPLRETNHQMGEIGILNGNVRYSDLTI